MAVATARDKCVCLCVQASLLPFLRSKLNSLNPSSGAPVAEFDDLEELERFTQGLEIS